MNDPASTRITRLSELPRDIRPPHDGWPALEARLRESGVPSAKATAARGLWRGTTARVVAVAAVLAAVAVGISIDRLLLSPARPPARTAALNLTGGNAGSTALVAAFVSDPRYLRERATLLRSLDARLAALPPPTRRQVLASLATIHQSMREIEQALGREPGNALLQELLVDTYQDEMRVLTAVQETNGGSGET